MLAGALFYLANPAAARAQVTGPPGSEVPLPPKVPADSTPDSLKVKRDTIKPAIARFHDPISIDQATRTEWNREELFGSGAFTLADLLDGIPELTTFRSGWISTPQLATFNGDVRRVRVFYDDIELDDLDSRDGGSLDLSTVQIWTLEHVTLERSATELRIHLRSWRVDRVTAYTRTDIATGNENTNLYRGFYGKRFDHGQILQVAGQQYGSSSTHSAGSGDQLSLLTRIGIGRKNWSVDAFVNRTHPNRSTQVPFNAGHAAIPPFNATHTLSYVRAGLGSSESGAWLQLVAASMQFRESSPHTTAAAGTSATTASGIAVPADTADTTRSETQLNLVGGFAGGPLKLTLQERVRTTLGVRTNSESGRVELARGSNVLSAFAEKDGLRSQTTADVNAHLQPFSFIALNGGAGRRSSSSAGGGGPTSTAFRGNVGLRLARLWLSGGVITADTLTRAAPVVYDTSFRAETVGRSTGTTGSLRGPLWRGFGIDSWLTHWSHATAYQPRYQSRFELNFANDFLNRFPRGDFALKAAASIEYRSRVTFLGSSDAPGATSSKVINGILEIRILRAILSYQQRNVIGYQYDFVPGFQMPRVLAIYGVRWEFWN